MEVEQKQQTELEQVQAEVTRLRERLRLMEEGQTHNLTSAVNERVANTGVKEVEGK